MKHQGRRGGTSVKPRRSGSDETRYRVAIPSREEVLAALESAGRPLEPKALFAALGVDDPEVRSALGNRLRAMIRDGQIIANRRGHYCLVGHIGLVAGIVTGHRDGYGFVTPDAGGDDIYLPPREMREVMHGDKVAVRIARTDERGRAEGKLVEVLARNTSEIVGRYVRESGVGFVIPDNRRFAQSVAVPPAGAKGVKPGDIVVVELIEPPSRDTQPIGRVIENLGEGGAPGVETEIAMRAHDLPFRWPAEALAEAEGWGDRVRPAAKRGREDLRDTPLVTIDGADAKDFDDAVWCEPDGKGWRVIVAIADVSAYVPVGGPLDAEARERGTSVYFPRKVIPMLPENLSNGLCSLNPGVDRLCMVCDMRVGSGGKVQDARFYEGLMRSAARLTYDEVAGMLVEGDPALRRRYAKVLPHLEHLHAVWRVLARARARRGAVDFDLPEVSMVFDPKGHVARVEPRHRNDAHRIIEECMIAANVEAARFLEKQKIPTLYRVHAPPEEDRLGALKEFLSAFGLSLPTRERLEPKHFSALVAEVAGRPDADLIETVILRSMRQAVYQPENIGHFGLALERYAHFTSPIRRYPDLLVHRAIRHALRGGQPTDFSYGKPEMEGLGKHCSATERRADEATRDAMDWLKCEFMLDRVGETFDVVVTGVVDFGLFVQIPEFQIDGLVHISSLGGDYYQRDPVHHRLVGEHTGRVFRLSDRLHVRLQRVSLEDRKIDFELAEVPEEVVKGRRGRRTRRK
ncbi:ribonuclease R [Wenzhouxiangella sp. XN24]|uniref:ribonuclease R n=1 Tax=Wenzhouxiangella sp. XN24 TaxID=2713569 RepID=UPI0013EB31E6|nr:ribonuclease R [Wenzhouxiangella sp. XN24]NGX15488.1 ribonuclease R [Wenzhouxiangella sp. XN24]